MRSYVSVFNGDSDQGTSGMTQFEDEVGHIRRQLRGGQYHKNLTAGLVQMMALRLRECHVQRSWQGNLSLSLSRSFVDSHFFSINIEKIKRVMIN